MEENQLDFNAPLLSVRRFSSTLANSNRDTRGIYENALPNRRHNLLSVKSDLDLDQVTDPVAIPFLWEHIPGRAKSKSGPQPQLRPLEVFSDNPRLPPGKVWDIIPLPSNKALEDQNVLRTKAQVSLLNSNLTILESLKEDVNEKGISEWEIDDDAYSDAHDTLSPASFSLNWSVSGLSGSDGLDVKPSGTFSTDPQTRDFMLSRFLPAAKAMTLESPHYVSRKQSLALAHEQPREVKKMVSEDKKPPLKYYEPRNIPYFEHDKGEEESESEDDNYVDNSVIASAKSCGFLPRFCAKNSLCLLNPVPGMKQSTQPPKASISEVRRKKKTQSGPLSQTVDTHALDAIYKNKFHYGSNNMQTGKSNHVRYSGDLKTTDRASPYMHPRVNGISPYLNEAPVSPFHQGMGFLGVPKEAGQKLKGSRSNVYNKGRDNFHKVCSYQKKKRGSGSSSPMVEKTLYIDSVNVVEYSNSNSNSLSSDIKGKNNFASKNFDILAESRDMETTAESSVHEINSLNVLKGSSVLKAKVSEFREADPPSYPDTSHLEDQADMTRALRVYQGLDQESRSLERLNVNSDQNIKEDTRIYSDVSSLQSPLHPPLPKSPSESWLWHTKIPSRNPSPYSRKLAPTTSSTGTKWENIVKTSYLHHDHVRYSEELVAKVRKQSRT